VLHAIRRPQEGELAAGRDSSGAAAAAAEEVAAANADARTGTPAVHAACGDGAARHAIPAAASQL
jgi:hypothetical protein